MGAQQAQDRHVKDNEELVAETSCGLFFGCVLIVSVAHIPVSGNVKSTSSLWGIYAYRCSL